MKRDIEICIQKALNSNTVYLYGLSGVGKTYSALNIAKESSKNYYYVDLNTDIDILNAMNLQPENAYNILLSFLNGFKLDNGQSMLIVDGTEELSERARKVLISDIKGSCAILIGVLPLSFYKLSVPRIVSFRMNSLSFEEYLLMIGKNNYREMLNARKHFHKPIPGLFLEDIAEDFNNYLICGGFPTAIQAAILHSFDISLLYSEHKRIVYTILQELYRYIDKNQLYSYTKLKQLIQVFSDNYDRIDATINLSGIRKGLSYNNLKEELRYLEEFGLFQCVKIGKGIRLEPTDPAITRLFLKDYNIIIESEKTKDIPIYILQNYLYKTITASVSKPEAFHLGRKAFLSIFDRESKTAYLCCKSNHSLNVANTFYAEYSDHRIICLFPEINLMNQGSYNRVEDSINNSDGLISRHKPGIYKMSYIEL